MIKKIKYHEFVKKSSKKVDSWVEVFIFDCISNPIGYVVYNLLKKITILTYLLTILHFILKLFSAVLFLNQMWLNGAILFFIANIFDNIDGKIARIMYGSDPDKRGTSDFLLDMFSLALIYSCIAIGLIHANNTNDAYLFILLLGANLFFMAANSTKFRTYGVYSYKPTVPLRETSDASKQNVVLRTIFKLQEFALKFRTSFHPSNVESEFIAIILFSIFARSWLIIVAIMITLLDTIATGLFPSYILLSRNKE